ncbi:MAG: NADH-quinone oxidoreductase subunit C [Bacteroidota bacterium]
MAGQKFEELLANQFGDDAVISVDENATPKALYVNADYLVAICEFLKDHKDTYFDMLSCLTGIDNGPDENTMEVVYNLYSIPLEHSLMLKVKLSREHPELNSLAATFAAADWHEREAYDLLGIQFSNHPNLRRILMPADWDGYPLRKDYEEPDSYRGMKTIRDEGETE